MYKEGYDLGYVDGYAQIGDYTIEYTYHTHDVPDGGTVTAGYIGWHGSYKSTYYCDKQGGCYNTPVYMYYHVEYINNVPVSGNEGMCYVTSTNYQTSSFYAADGTHRNVYTYYGFKGYMQDCGLTEESIDAAIIKFNN